MVLRACDLPLPPGRRGAVLGLMTAVLVAANASNVIDPRQGFGGHRHGRRARARVQGSRAARVVRHLAGVGTRPTPPLIDTRIDERLAHRQRPKAIICVVLLVVFVVLSAAVWRTLMQEIESTSGRVDTERPDASGGGGQGVPGVPAADADGHRQHPGLVRPDVVDAVLQVAALRRADPAER